MKLIERTTYMNRLTTLIQTPDIKMITGIRRSGKSKLLESFIHYINNTDTEANIIYIDFNLLDYESLKEYHALHQYVIDKQDASKHNYVMIDEIQECNGFEKAINSLHAKGTFDLYLTGSNAFLLSSDLATLFTGRYIEIKVYPFSFSEYVQYHEDSIDQQALFDRYFYEGGMSGSYIYGAERDRTMYLNSVLKTISEKDLMIRYRIKDIALMNRITDFLLDNISNLTSASNISTTLKHNGLQTNHNTIMNYIQYMCHAFLFYEVRRYDVKGKQYLGSAYKYYLCDHGFRFARLGNKDLDYGRVYENIVYVELLRRGYDVFIGKLYQKEIDFVAKKRDEILYIQVSDDITDETTRQREVESLLKIKDGYTKLLIARTKHDTYTLQGVKVVDLVNWLLDQ